METFPWVLWRKPLRAAEEKEETGRLYGAIRGAWWSCLADSICGQCARHCPGLVQAVSEPAQDKNRLANLGLEKGPPSVLSLPFLTCSCVVGMHVCMFVIRHTCMHMLMEAQG